MAGGGVAAVCTAGAVAVIVAITVDPKVAVAGDVAAVASKVVAVRFVS